MGIENIEQGMIYSPKTSAVGLTLTEFRWRSTGLREGLSLRGLTMCALVSGLDGSNLTQR
jgi:hypothetical protein